ncbi:hypothetical protein J504_1986 [Acinetobacter baumannii 348935]|nr:hypothetical protein J504_1986 [Acinetobacter baumannii 348935]
MEWNTARLILMFTDFAHYKTSRFKDVFILYLLITLKWMLFKKLSHTPEKNHPSSPILLFNLS